LRLRLIGIGAAVLSLLANIVFQRVLMNAGVQGAVLIPGLADFRPAWNHGVSFSLLTQDSATGRHLLIAALAIVTVGVLIVMWRATSRRGAGQPAGPCPL
jgi:lipoprotein signal peptidase